MGEFQQQSQSIESQAEKGTFTVKFDKQSQGQERSLYLVSQ